MHIYGVGTYISALFLQLYVVLAEGVGEKCNHLGTCRI